MWRFFNGGGSENVNKGEDEEMKDKESEDDEYWDGDGEDHDDDELDNLNKISSPPHVSDNAGTHRNMELNYPELRALFTSREEFCRKQFAELQEQMSCVGTRLAILEADVSSLKKDGNVNPEKESDG
ncbi:hypothetical protein M5689_003210 [Euphorbia peplus]|nr:hypothetical protein M5689_003210 [Euphorbia peplus]